MIASPVIQAMLGLRSMPEGAAWSVMSVLSVSEAVFTSRDTCTSGTTSTGIEETLSSNTDCVGSRVDV
jgi:hypothetical protein